MKHVAEMGDSLSLSLRSDDIHGYRDLSPSSNNSRQRPSLDVSYSDIPVASSPKATSLAPNVFSESHVDDLRGKSPTNGTSRPYIMARQRAETDSGYFYKEGHRASTPKASSPPAQRPSLTKTLSERPSSANHMRTPSLTKSNSATERGNVGYREHFPSTSATTPKASSPLTQRLAFASSPSENPTVAPSIKAPSIGKSPSMGLRGNKVYKEQVKNHPTSAATLKASSPIHNDTFSKEGVNIPPLEFSQLQDLSPPFSSNTSGVDQYQAPSNTTLSDEFSGNSSYMLTEGEVIATVLRGRELGGKKLKVVNPLVRVTLVAQKTGMRYYYLCFECLVSM